MRVSELIQILDKYKDLDYIVCDSTGNAIRDVTVGLVEPDGENEQDGIKLVAW